MLRLMVQDVGLIAWLVTFTGCMSFTVLATLGLDSGTLQGFSYALEHGYDFVFEMPADFSHDPKQLPEFLNAAQKADLVLGSRYVPGGKVLSSHPVRRTISRMGNDFARIMLRLPIHDCTCDYRCYRTKSLTALHLDQIRSHDYALQIELAYSMWRSGFVVRELPVAFYDRTPSPSRMSPRYLAEALAWVIKTSIKGSPVVRERAQPAMRTTDNAGLLSEDVSIADTLPVAVASRLEIQGKPEYGSSSIRNRILEAGILLPLLICAATFVGYMLLGAWLYNQWRIPVGNTGIYAQGMHQIATRHLSGFVTFVGYPIGVDAGEFIAYIIAPVYAVLGLTSLWLVQGASIVAAEILTLLIARDMKLAKWQQIVMVVVVALNPFVFMNFLTSWDFDILFVPAVLLLFYLTRKTLQVKHLPFICALIFLICLIKDEAPIILAAWGLLTLIFRIGQRSLATAVIATSLVYYVGLHLILSHLGYSDNQIALHYPNIGGAGGLKGIIVFAVSNPLAISDQLYQNRGYLFELILASGGAILMDPTGLACWFVGLINALGSGPLGVLMSLSNFEFTLMNVPFLFIALLRTMGRKFSPMVGSLVAIGLFTLAYIAYFAPVMSAPIATQGAIQSLNRLESWYWAQSPRPAFYGQNDSATHFLGSTVVGIEVDDLRQITAEALHDHLPLVIAYDSQLQNDAAPHRWYTEIGSLIAYGDLTLIPEVSNSNLHVFYLNERRFQSQNFYPVTPVQIEIAPWMWHSNTVTLDLPPGQYHISRAEVMASGDDTTLTNQMLSIGDSAYVVPVTLTGSGSLLITKLST